MEDTDVTTQPAWQLSDAIDTLVENDCCANPCCAQNPKPQT